MSQTPSHQQLYAELAFTIAWPAFFLMKGSSWLGLSTEWGLMLALLGPIGFGLYGMINDGRVSPLAALSFVSTLMTGGVGLLNLDPRWLAIKEAMLPAALGIAAVATAHTSYSAVLVLLNRLLDPVKVANVLSAEGHAAYKGLTTNASRQVGLLFAFSALANFILCSYVVHSPSGTEAFNEELGRFTLYSWPAIALPSALGMMWVLQRVLNGLEDVTNVPLDDLLLPAFSSKKSES